jgi:hypothetical protein
LKIFASAVASPAKADVGLIPTSANANVLAMMSAPKTTLENSILSLP